MALFHLLKKNISGRSGRFGKQAILSKKTAEIAQKPCLNSDTNINKLLIQIFNYMKLLEK
jgi:hypothetical protein